MKPIGSVGGKPIWPRVMQRVKSLGRVFLDDDGFAYETNDRNVVDLLHRMDREENFQRTMQFLDRIALE
ncbi:Protein C17F4.2 [Aphelenchoides avenae]|nr:Protein C17F4.2 [Aphelenchus avenae]KAH7716815.1 Protein C17F4.2 [Aphelenchus avenae]